jgi:hypothetical protein
LVTTFMVMASFQTSMSVLDFVVLLGIGLLGMAMNELNWPRSAFALGFVLGPSLERYFFLTYQIWGWSWLEQPLVLLILGLGVFTVLRQSREWRHGRKGAMATPPALPDMVFGGALAVLAVAVFLSAIRFPLDAGLFPAITATVLAGAALFATVHTGFRLWRKSHRDGDAAEAVAPAGEWSAASGIGVQGYASILGLCAVQAFLILAAGHLVGSFVFATGALILFGRQRLPAILIAAGATLVIAAVFDGLVSQPWPRPWLAILIDRLVP